MRHLLILLALAGCATVEEPVVFKKAGVALPPKPVTAQALVRRFAREFCVPGADRLGRIRAWRLPGWQAGKSETNLGVTFAVDGPIPEHDFYSLSHEGPVQGGKANIYSFIYDYKEKGPPDNSSASLSIKPDRLIDKATIEKILGVKLIPNGKLDEGGSRLRITMSGKEPVMSTPQTGFMQHYEASSSFGERVTITARRMWGEGEDPQSWYLGCSTYRPPIVHSHSN